MPRKRILLWVLAFVFALIVGPLLGRGIAWLKVYSEPSRPVIIQIKCDCEQCGCCARKPNEKQRFF